MSGNVSPTLRSRNLDHHTEACMQAEDFPDELYQGYFRNYKKRYDQK